MDIDTRCSQMMEDLMKSPLERNLTGRPEDSMQMQEEIQTSKVLAAELCKAIRSGSVLDFVEALKETAVTDKKHVSSIVGQVSNAGNTVLHMAAYYGKVEILQLLATHVPQLITRRNNTGDTVLHIAARNWDESSIHIILSCYKRHFENKYLKKENNEEALWRMRNEHGNTPLHEAVVMAYGGPVEVAEILFEEDEGGAHLENKEGKSPLCLAIQNRNYKVARLLLQAPFPNGERHRGSCPLHAENSGFPKDSALWSEGIQTSKFLASNPFWVRN
ncbi:ankyrin repeat-containing protein ITN1-like [Prosopis cineraria]|uniref:ankyrin repeat-containing protein ITN1-like n=1 Tax=Prosopis cineraria TaxID=364024 RepID=UPI0024101DA4|nr:ankyrin repeat-containing protein ITN1-like [Prosopis cineraria]